MTGVAELLASGSPLPAAEQLREIVRAAFPERSEIASASLGRSARDVWRQLCVAAGVDPGTLASAIAKQLNIEVADLTKSDPFLVRMFPESFSLQHLVFPVHERGGRLVVAVAYPVLGGGLRRAEFLANRKIDIAIAPPDEIEIAISRAYRRAAEQKGGSLGTIALDQGEEIPGTELSAVVKLGRALVAKAIEERASDLHIQPFAGGGMVRIRVDGILRRIAFLTGPVREALVRYIKAQGGMDPTNNRVAQDGRMTVVLATGDYELRLSVLPANRGETLVVRFLDQRRVHLLKNAGFSAAALQALRRLASNSAGVILVTGPTGSGKSSTLYGMLNEINRVGVNIITVENPVEYRIAGISQVDVNVKAGLTFASALRAILRQDPDVILIGEIRDAETAGIAMQAALTGHLVLSTLHTNDALTAIPRLGDLGVDASVMSDAIVGVVAQRLFRRLCGKCRQPVTEPLLPDEKYFADVVNEQPAYRAIGCPACGGSGFVGRFPIAEVVEMVPEVRSAVARGERDIAVLRELVRGPLSSMSYTAARRVISGDTTAGEAARILGQRFWSDLSREYHRPLPSGAPAALSESESENAGLGVLLFSRDTASARAWAQGLAAANFRVVTVSDPQEARLALERDSNIMLNIVDLDAGTPDENLELTKRLRVSLAWASLPRVVIVPDNDSRLRAVLEEHDVTDYLVKNVFDLGEVVARVRAVLAR